jgi:hypothetical protein
MTRTQILVLALGCAVAGAGCESASTEPSAPPSVARGGSDLPFSESYSAAGTITSSPSCPAGTLLVELAGGGTATHIGRYTISNSHCLDLATGVFTNGTFLKTAPNGDQLIGTYGGGGSILEPPLPPTLVGRFAITGTIVFTGGTGRYAGASGTAAMTGTQVTNFSAQDLPTEIRLDMEGSFSW